MATKKTKHDFTAMFDAVARAEHGLRGVDPVTGGWLTGVDYSQIFNPTIEALDALNTELETNLNANLEKMFEADDLEVFRLPNVMQSIVSKQTIAWSDEYKSQANIHAKYKNRCRRSSAGVDGEDKTSRCYVYHQAEKIMNDINLAVKNLDGQISGFATLRGSYMGEQTALSKFNKPNQWRLQQLLANNDTFKDDAALKAADLGISIDAQGNIQFKGTGTNKNINFSYNDLNDNRLTKQNHNDIVDHYDAYGKGMIGISSKGYEDHDSNTDNDYKNIYEENPYNLTFLGTKVKLEYHGKGAHKSDKTLIPKQILESEAFRSIPREADRLFNAMSLKSFGALFLDGGGRGTDLNNDGSKGDIPMDVYLSSLTLDEKTAILTMFDSEFEYESDAASNTLLTTYMQNQRFWKRTKDGIGWEMIKPVGDNFRSADAYIWFRDATKNHWAQNVLDNWNTDPYTSGSIPTGYDYFLPISAEFE